MSQFSKLPGNTVAFEEYLRRLVGPFREFQSFKFSHGQSNPTYLIRIDGQPRIVLRKKPPPPILPSAHAIEREYRVLLALCQVGFPVPKPVDYCEDASILGTPFYVMEFVDGDIFESCDLANVDDTSSRRLIYFQMARMLAKLHSIDPHSVGLSDFGKASGYAARQVEIWYKQFKRSQGQKKNKMWNKMNRLYGALRSRASMVQQTQQACIAHGDFRLDNIIYDRQSRTVLGLLDWELSTLGDPLADLAYSCLPYYIPRHVLPQMALPKDPLPPGIPTMSEYVQVYCGERHIAPPAQEDWNFYVALALFRLSSILAGVSSRAQHGNASSQHAAEVSSDEHVLALIDTALQLVAPDVLKSFADDNRIFLGDRGSRIRHILDSLKEFMECNVMPVEHILTKHAQSRERWTIHPIQEQLKRQAQLKGLWNLWISPDLAKSMNSVVESCCKNWTLEQLLGAGLSNTEYAMCAEIMGYSPWASEIFNCSAPDTGNMEVLARYGSREQQEKWLLPLLKGDIRSCFAMTEQQVASSDATNIRSSIVLDEENGSYVLNGKKWWISGACDPRCRVAIFMGKTSTCGSSHTQQSMVLVEMPHAGITEIKPLTVFGYDDAPHGHAEMTFEDVRVPKSNIILGIGRGFEIAQGRLGPGRLHHCMRLVGMGQRALDLCLERIQERKTFGKKFFEHQSIREDIARCRIELDAARLVVLNAAAALDAIGAKAARSQISEAKVYAPACVLGIIDRVIQIFGGAGVSDKFPLASMYSAARTLRLADGPDNVHLETIAKVEIRRASL